VIFNFRHVNKKTVIWINYQFLYVSFIRLSSISNNFIWYHKRQFNLLGKNRKDLKNSWRV